MRKPKSHEMVMLQFAITWLSLCQLTQIIPVPQPLDIPVELTDIMNGADTSCPDPRKFWETINYYCSFQLLSLDQLVVQQWRCNTMSNSTWELDTDERGIWQHSSLSCLFWDVLYSLRLEVDFETRKLSINTLSGKWSLEALIGKRRLEIGKERKTIYGAWKHGGTQRG
jgi:hypothetical protein